MRKWIKPATLALGLALGAHGAQAATIVNGGFDSNTSGQIGYNAAVKGWTVDSGGYDFVFTAGAADTTGATGQYGGVGLWGPGNGAANGLTASSPDGGSFVALDGAFGVKAIYQTITNLAVGATYAIGFWWAGAQQYNFDGPNTEQFKVSLGGQSQWTSVAYNTNHGFTGWMHQTMLFTATSTTEVLSFLANGSPAGVPPFSLLDGVTLTQVPEPASWALMSALLAGGGILMARRRVAQRNAV